MLSSNCNRKPQFLMDVIFNRLHTRIVMLLIYFFSFFIVIMSIENWIGFQSVYTRQYAMDFIDILSSRFFMSFGFFWYVYIYAHFFFIWFWYRHCHKYSNITILYTIFHTFYYQYHVLLTFSFFISSLIFAYEALFPFISLCTQNVNRKLLKVNKSMWRKQII